MPAIIELYKRVSDKSDFVELRLYLCMFLIYQQTQTKLTVLQGQITETFSYYISSL